MKCRSECASVCVSLSLSAWASPCVGDCGCGTLCMCLSAYWLVSAGFCLCVNESV